MKKDFQRTFKGDFGELGVSSFCTINIHSENNYIRYVILCKQNKAKKSKILVSTEKQRDLHLSYYTI